MSTTAPAARLVSSCGLDLAPDADRWFAAPDEDDLFALDGLDHPILDVGCGPGRIVAHLAAQGVTTLGVDVSTEAILHARELGAPVLHRSIFEPLPGTGRWGAAVLLDGNIGIGGDPAALLVRLHELLRPGGRVVAEVGEPGSETRVIEARISMGDSRTGWFPWAVVGADGIGAAAVLADMTLLSIRRSGERWFATLQRD
ncbi:class I SAM-dependent methyltransferase [Actinospongicola halichondriae]|uniref:class I SAM-dependent methyltransferase n=1 Tax=Actinospongicola halichondriae TaxID=3236844 RepID=UPI003D3731C9